MKNSLDYGKKNKKQVPLKKKICEGQQEANNLYTNRIRYQNLFRNEKESKTMKG